MFEIIDNKGDTTHQLTAEEVGEWVTQALSLAPEHQPPLLVIKHCSLGG